MAKIIIDIDKVRTAVEPAIAYQPNVTPRITAEESNPLLIIELPGAQAVDMKALETISNSLCGYLWGRGHVGVVNCHVCLSFWKDDLLKDFIIDNPQNTENNG